MKFILLQNMIYLPAVGGANKSNRLLLEHLAATDRHRCHALAPAFGSHGPQDRAGLLRELAGLGLAPEAETAEGLTFALHGVRVEAVFNRQQMRQRAAQLLRQVDPTWVLVTSEDPGQELLEVALEIFPERVVYIVHTPLHLPFGPQSFLQHREQTERLRRVAGILTVSDYVKGYLRDHARLASQVLHFPVYGSGPFPELGRFDEGSVTLINPCAYKGIDIFMELAHRMPTTAFAAVPTWGSTEEDLASLAALPNVQRIAPSENIDQVFAQIRVLLMPSVWQEAFGLLAVEAMLRGLPVLASDVGGLPEAKLGVEHLLPVRPIERFAQRFNDREYPIAEVPPQDVGPWQTCLEALLADRERYEELSARSRAAALAFVEAATVAPFEKFFTDLEPGSQRPPEEVTAEPAAPRTPSAGDGKAKLSKLSRDQRALLALRALRARGQRPQKAAEGEIPALPRGEQAQGEQAREDQPGGEPVRGTIKQGFRAATFPLSFGQQRLWFLAQLEPDSVVYNEAGGLRLVGHLDVEALRRAVGEIVRRHEVLRTVFEPIDGAPRQRVLESLEPAFLVEDLSTAPDPEAAARRRGSTLVRRPFDLRRGPLLRLILLHLAAADHVLLISAHHIICDGWSMGIFIRELTALYRAFLAGAPSPLPERVLDYADFAHWQRDPRRGEAMEAQLEFWQKTLKEPRTHLELPTDRPRSGNRVEHGAALPVRLPRGLTDALVELGQREGTTLFMTLLAAFYVLLHRYTGAADVVVGTDVAGRGRSQLEDMIGFFINQLVLRVDLGGNPPFTTLLERVREATTAAYSHQDLPFERVVEALQPERDIDRNPLFEVVFGLQNAPFEALALPGLTSHPWPLERGTAKFELVLFLAEGPEGLLGRLEYSLDLFEAPRMHRLLRHYERLLSAVVSAGHRRISELPLLGRVERHQLLRAWNDAPAAGPAAERAPAHELFRRQARRSPDAVAVVCGGHGLSYRHLEHRAAQLARQLGALGVGHEQVVALLAERGLAFLTAVLAVWKSGAAYLPLDPHHPAERLRQVLAASRSPLVLVEEALCGPLDQAVAHLPAAARPRLQDLGALLSSSGDTAPVGGAAAPQDLVDRTLAYVIYTSGSTGMPKGAMVEHRGMGNHLAAKIGALGITPAAVVAQNAAQCFDISVWQFIAPLLVGGRVAFYRDEVAHDPQTLLRRVARDRVTLLEVVPSMLRFMLDEVAASKLSALRFLIPTGEALPPELCNRWLEGFPEVPLLNAYGPTECSDDVSHHPVRRPLPESAPRTPIGRPIPGLVLYVLGPALELLPAGVTGELWVGGVGMGRGYLADGRRTAEAFGADPFATESGARLYRTGDFVRWREDGSLDFFGRRDHQIKLHGFRIELGEIEKRLAEHPGVREAVAMVQDDRLGAFLVAEDEGPADGRGSTEGDPRVDERTVDQWQSIFDEVYGERQLSEQDAGIHLRVWVSSYTGAAMPEEEIRECFHDSVERILSLEPQRVLELGCGSGLLLRRIVPHCEYYCGTDLSAPVLDDLRQSLAADGISNVDLEVAAADELNGLPSADFDLVVLNEVVQYFPSVEYLERVMEGVVALLRPGGLIFVGGVRSHRLLPTFHTSVQLHRAAEELSAEELRLLATSHLDQDKELAVDPAFFFALMERLEALGEVRVQLKGGRAHNELTCFRYDAVLRVGASEAPRAAPLAPLDWQEEELTLAGLEHRLRAEAPDRLWITGVPNARLAAMVEARNLLASGSGDTAGEIRQSLTAFAATSVPGVEPEDLWALGNELPYAVGLSWGEPAEEGLLHVVLERLNASAEASVGPSRWARFPALPPAPRTVDRPLCEYANVPRSGELTTGQIAVEEVHAFLAKRLPEYMVPTSFHVLEEIPLTPNGKVDRQALGKMAQHGVSAPEEAPRNPIEEVLVALWSEVLGRERLGIQQNFFELGGHSLLATQLVARVSRAFRCELQLRSIFEHPTVADLATYLEGTLRGADAVAPPPLVPVPRSGPAALSFAQHRLWFLDQLDPGSAAYNISLGLHLWGDLEPAVLARCLDEIVRRHESLRTVFVAPDPRSGADDPTQRILPPTPPPLPRVDLAALPAQSREEELRRLLNAEGRQPFDLTCGPLFRARLFSLAARKFALMLTCHHIASDGWSMGILVRELVALYGAYQAGETSPLSPLPVQYSDYALWERRRLSGEMQRQQLAWWREQLADLTPAELPTDQPRPAVQTFRGGHHAHTLSEALSQRLEALSRHQGATLFMTLLATFQVLLARLSGARDVAVGTPIAGRGQPEIEDVIGIFLNTLVLRGDLSGNPSFEDFLGRVREVALGAYAHQDLPFEQVLEELQPERDLSRTPFFQVFFNMLTLPGEDEEVVLPGLQFESLALPEMPSKFDLTVYARQDRGRIRFRMVYNADLFTAARIAELSLQYEYLLSQVVEDPAHSIEEFSLRTPQAAALLPDPTAELGTAWCGPVHELFAREAERVGERTALISIEGHWSYAAVAAESRRLADRLVGQGLGPGEVVAIYAHRSAALVWAVLGVLKAGGVVLLLDPAYPAPRLIDILQQARPRVWIELMAAGPLPEALEVFVSALSGCPRLGLPEAAAAVLSSRGVAEVLRRSVGPDDPACLAFTSGSTGVPKGVLGRHGSLSHFLPWQRRHFALAGNDRYSMLSGLAHDPLQRDLFTSLCLGATLCVPEPEEMFTTGYLAGWMKRQRVSVSNLTPAMAQILTTRSADHAPVPTLRLAFLVGDVLTRRDVARLWQLAPAVRCINLYGSTETQRALSYYEVPTDAGDGSQLLPLGRGMQDAELLILTSAGQPAGVGEVGEICVRSAFLAAGYLGDEELTRKRFQPNPLRTAEGDRIYRTGDLGRYLPGGDVVFAGRTDHQLQIRGFRIELGEIESHLRVLPELADGVVVAQEGGEDLRLVAFVVPAATGAEVAVEVLRRRLAETLPSYMIPGAFIVLEGLPLTPHGKVDRRALAERSPTEAGGGAVAPGAAPRDHLEESLVALWAEILERPAVGIHDGFFDLGGHSLLATRLVARLEEMFRVQIPLRTVFERSTVAEFSPWLAAALGGGERRAPVLLEPGPPRARAPLSFAQQRLWFLNRLEPGGAAYNIPLALRIRGPLRVDILNRCLVEIVSRHASLRTVFVADGEEPQQVVSPPAPVGLPYLDLRSLVPDRADAEVERCFQKNAQAAFDLVRGPLFRVLLIERRAGEHILLWTMHHIISDAWSMGVLVRELTVLYEAFAAGRPSPLPPLVVQAPDVAVWQRRTLQGEVLAEELAWWRDRLAGAPKVLELPADRPRRSSSTGASGRCQAVLGTPWGERLRGLNRRLGMTSFMTLLAVFNGLLARITGQRDLVVGSPIANRGQTHLEPLIGFFVNTLVLRSNLGTDALAEASFRRLLEGVRETCLGAYAHRDLPFERLVEELAPERDLYHSPLFQVMFVLHNAPHSTLDLAGLEFEELESLPTGAKFDLTLTAAERGDGLYLTLDYDSGLFDSSRMVRFLQHYQNLLGAICEDADRRLDELPLLSRSEQQRLLVEWNDTQTNFVSNATLPELFVAQVERVTDAVAVVAEEHHLSYGELNRRANQLAWVLQSQGVGPEVRVGVCLERTVEMVMSLLAVLKAGGLYVPLDTTWPAERLHFLLEDTAAHRVLTAAPASAALPESEVAWFDLDREQSLLAEQSGENPPSLLRPSNLAYVIYTSGSTGRPKGVEVSHAAFSNLFFSVAETVGADGGNVWLAAASLSFDIAGLEIFLPLLTGSRTVLVSRSIASDGQRLSGLIEASRATFLQATPATWRMLVDVGWEGRRHLARISGGEALAPELEAQLSAAHGVGTWNLYGPTEATVYVTGGRMEAAAAEVTIGRPLQNIQAMVLDKHLLPVPEGVSGELALGGAGIARGYLGRPAPTAERFVPNPNAAAGGGFGGRLYRTGDLVRHRPGGALFYLGRIDHQVKIRGFRIELGEIESTLRTLPDLADCAVVAQEGPLGSRLVAFVVPASEGVEGAPLSAEALRRHLAKALPDYMIPGFFITLNALPLTSSGKVNRKQLAGRSSVDSGAEDRASGAAPRDPLEESLVGLWGEILELPQVGVHDSFFDLGGHSLLATRLVTRMQEMFRVQIPLSTLFERSTVAEFSLWLAGALGGGDSPLPAILKAEPELSRAPLSFAQERLWFLARLRPDSAAYNLPMALSLRGRLRVGALRASLHQIIARHGILRTTLPMIEGEASQVIAAPPTDTSIMGELPLLDLSTLAPARRDVECKKQLESTVARPFDLAQGPLLRCLLVYLGKGHHIFLANLHHIISDGWSMDVMVRELQTLYSAFLEGTSPSLPELPVQYSDYAVWQRQHLEGKVLESQLHWWRELLTGAPPELDLSTDRPRALHRSPLAGHLAVRWSPQRLAALKDLGRRRLTLFMILLAGWKALLARQSGQRDLVVGTTIANRNRGEVEPLIGFFVNTLALRTHHPLGSTFADLLEQVRGVCLGAYAHQDLPFERLVEDLEPERRLHQTPLFQTMLVLQNVARSDLELPGLELESVPLELSEAKFDLTLTAVEAADGLHFGLEYNRDLFDSTSMARLLGHFERVLEGMVADPERPVAALPLLGAAERHQLEYEWNDTARSYPQEATVHGLFEEWTQRAPEAQALAFGDGGTMSYGELDRQANTLAGVLMVAGVAAETPVAFCLGSTPEMVVATLAILKAGGVYVPLDPTWPREHMAFLLADSGALVLLALGAFRDALPEVSQEQRVIWLDQRAPAVRETRCAAPAMDADRLAYLMYTSGSTGRPKGVAVRHRGIVRLVRGSEFAPLGPADRVAQGSTPAFDAATFEIWGALLNGSCLVLLPRDAMLTPPALQQVLQHHAVTAMFLTTPLFNQLARQEPTLFAALKQVVIGGDAIDPEAARGVLAAEAAPRLVNGYGPTEGTTFSTWYAIPPGLPESGRVPIGRPVANTTVHVLDRDMVPSPIAVPGQLFLGGAGLARGYHGRPSRTARTFLPDPASGSCPARPPGARLYATGDLVRALADGAMDFLGRIDHQVKIRGFRIEPGEVEVALRAFPEVNEAVVVVRGDGSDRSLVAYVVGLADAEDLRAALCLRLPEFMVPGAIVILDALPLNANGKVDRGALPDPQRQRTAAWEAPATALEEQLAAIWSDLLGHEGIGRRDDFFALGGHSLKVTQVASRVRESLGLELPLGEFFARPTLVDQAIWIEQELEQQKEEGAVPAGTDLDDLLAELDGMSDEEAERLLAAEEAEGNGDGDHQLEHPPRGEGDATE